MSEPYSAFIKLRMTRPELVGWLNARPPSASMWADWQSLGGRLYLEGRPQYLKDISADQLSKIIEDCCSESFATNRAALQSVLESAGEAPWLKYAMYDISSQQFVVGSLVFSENFTDFIVFLTIARGSGAFLGPNGYGVAVIHDYLFSSDGDTFAAFRLGPGASSSLLEKKEQPNAVAAFQDIVDEMLKPERERRLELRDDLESLR